MNAPMTKFAIMRANREKQRQADQRVLHRYELARRAAELANRADEACENFISASRIEKEGRSDSVRALLNSSDGLRPRWGLWARMSGGAET